MSTVDLHVLETIYMWKPRFDLNIATAQKYSSLIQQTYIIIRLDFSQKSVTLTKRSYIIVQISVFLTRSCLPSTVHRHTIPSTVPQWQKSSWLDHRPSWVH